MTTFTQVGGHEGAFTVPEVGRITKKVGHVEANFYSNLSGLCGSFVPQSFSVEQKADDYFVTMEDLTRNFKFPCIMDLKIGTNCAGEDCSPEKIERIRKKDSTTTTGSLGFRLTGYRSFTNKDGEFTVVSKDKPFGRSLTSQTVGENLIQFFNNGNGLRKEIIEQVIKQCEDISRWIKDLVGLKFISSSLLIIYDADPSNTQVVVKMIDFTHTFREEGYKNEDYHFGMENLISTLRANL